MVKRWSSDTIKVLVLKTRADFSKIALSFCLEIVKIMTKKPVKPLMLLTY